MKFSFWEAANDGKNVRTIEIANFSQLWDCFSEHRCLDQPGLDGKTPRWVSGFSPAEFDGVGTTNANVREIHFGVLDLDGISKEDFYKVCTKFKAIEHFVYSTFSHGVDPEKVAARLVFRISRSVKPEQWPAFWTGLRELAERKNDKVTFDPRRLYFVPCALRARWDSRFRWYWPGPEALDVDACIARGSITIQAKAVLQPDVSIETKRVSRGDLADLADVLRRRRKHASKEVGKALGLALAGEPFAGEGERDNTLFLIAGQIAEHYPNADPVSVADLLLPSIQATNAALKKSHEDQEFYDKMIEKITRLQEKKLAEIVKAVENRESDIRERIQAAFEGVGIKRDTPYSETELALFARNIGCSLKELRHRWIIQHEAAYYILFNGSYLRPLSEKAVTYSIIRDLAPASSAGVEVYNEDGSVRSLHELMQDYGTVARRGVVDITQDVSTYDAQTQSVIEAPCPQRDLTPEFNPVIDKWLRILAGEKYPLLETWLATATDLSRASVVIYLHGPRGIGKTSLANGLSRIWTDGDAVELGSGFREFTESLTQCPILLADEHMPAELKKAPTTYLRQFQQATSRRVRRKYLNDAELRGAFRIILTANNADLLHTEENLTNDDIDAMAQRFLYLPCLGERANQAQALLEGLGQLGLSLKKDFVQTGVMAKHVLWLAENVEVTESRRFIIEDRPDSHLVETMMTSSGIRSLVCQWVCTTLQTHGKSPVLMNMMNRHIVVAGGTLYATAQGIYDNWDQVFESSRRPSISRIAQALEGLSGGQKAVIPMASGLTPTFFAVRTDRLVHWSESTGFATGLSLRAMLTAVPAPAVDWQTVRLYSSDDRPIKKDVSLAVHAGITGR